MTEGIRIRVKDTNVCVEWACARGSTVVIQYSQCIDCVTNVLECDDRACRSIGHFHRKKRAEMESEFLFTRPLFRDLRSAVTTERVVVDVGCTACTDLPTIHLAHLLIAREGPQQSE